MKPTYEDLEAELKLTKQELDQTNKELGQTKVELHKALKLLKITLDKIAELEEKLNTNSKNSSKPPSTDNKGNTHLLNLLRKEMNARDSLVLCFLRKKLTSMLNVLTIIALIADQAQSN